MPTDGSPDEDRLSLRRRRVLAAGGVGIAAIAGCSSSDDDGADGSDASGSESDGSDDDTSSDETDDQEETDEDGADNDEEEDVEPALFEVVSVDHPEEVSTGEEHTFQFTVENTGGEDGTFEELLEFSIEGTDQWENIGMVQLDVPAGETATWESNPTEFDDPAALQFRLGDTEWAYDITATAPDPQSFSGNGQSVEQGINIEGGLVVLEASHDGESNFQVSLEATASTARASST